MAEQPELGQMMFGNPTGEYGTPNFVDALVFELLNQADRVYWNKMQRQWERYDDPKIEGMEFRAYYWGDDEDEANKPNLKFDFSPQEIRWYKHPGRGQTCSILWDEKQWVEWFEKAYDLICKADGPLFGEKDT